MLLVSRLGRLKKPVGLNPVAGSEWGCEHNEPSITNLSVPAGKKHASNMRNETLIYLITHLRNVRIRLTATSRCVVYSTRSDTWQSFSAGIESSTKAAFNKEQIRLIQNFYLQYLRKYKHDVDDTGMQSS